MVYPYFRSRGTLAGEIDEECSCSPGRGRVIYLRGGCEGLLRGSLSRSVLLFFFSCGEANRGGGRGWRGIGTS